MVFQLFKYIYLETFPQIMYHELLSKSSSSPSFINYLQIFIFVRTIKIEIVIKPHLKQFDNNNKHLS